MDNGLLVIQSNFCTTATLVKLKKVAIVDSWSLVKCRLFFTHEHSPGATQTPLEQLSHEALVEKSKKKDHFNKSEVKENW